MTNYEKYKDEIIQALFVNGSIGIDRKTGEFRGCGSLNCQGDCVLGIDNDGICDLGTTKEWLDSEYAEPEKEEVDWSKVPMDTMVLVSSNKKYWHKRYFAGVSCKTNRPQVFANGATSWSVGSIESCGYIKLYKND